MSKLLSKQKVIAILTLAGTLCLVIINYPLFSDIGLYLKESTWSVIANIMLLVSLITGAIALFTKMRGILILSGILALSLWTCTLALAIAGVSYYPFSSLLQSVLMIIDYAFVLYLALSIFRAVKRNYRVPQSMYHKLAVFIVVHICIFSIKTGIWISQIAYFRTPHYVITTTLLSFVTIFPLLPLFSWIKANETRLEPDTSFYTVQDAKPVRIVALSMPAAAALTNILFPTSFFSGKSDDILSAQTVDHLTFLFYVIWAVYLSVRIARLYRRAGQSAVPATIVYWSTSTVGLLIFTYFIDLLFSLTFPYFLCYSIISVICWANYQIHYERLAYRQIAAPVSEHMNRSPAAPVTMTPPPLTQRFCTSCGAKLPEVCRFCPRCGSDIIH